VLNDGRPRDYAIGLYVRKYRGVNEVSHSGSTAGYRAFLVRYPDQHVSVAVLCNASDANPTQYAHAVADAYMGVRFTEPAATPANGGGSTALTTGRGAQAASTFRIPITDLDGYSGRFASDEAETEFTALVDGDTLVLKQRPDRVIRLRPIEKDVFMAQGLGTVTFRRDTTGKVNELSIKQDRVWDLRFQRR